MGTTTTGTTFEATFSDYEGSIWITVPTSEDCDIAEINGTVVPTYITFPTSEDFEPEVYTSALAEGGWEPVEDMATISTSSPFQVRRIAR